MCLGEKPYDELVFLYDELEALYDERDFCISINELENADEIQDEIVFIETQLSLYN